MARMIPANLSFKTESKAEEKVFYALRNSLDDSHTIFHSFDLPVRNLKNRLIDAEIDFLIFKQKQGLLALEVKGGSIGYNGEQWLQNSKPLKESPYQQAKKNNMLSLITWKNESVRSHNSHLAMQCASPMCIQT